jgi:signal transduction histidine kinase
LGEDAGGALLVVKPARIDRLIDGKFQEAYELPGTLGLTLTNRVLSDHDGGIWIGSLRGLAHVHDGHVDLFSRIDGLTSDSVGAFFLDREGNIWVGTQGGLDRFSVTPGAQFTERQGFSNLHVTAVLASIDGSIWVRTLDSLEHWDKGHVTVFHDSPDLGGRAIETANAASYGNGLVRGGGSLFEDERGRVWVSGPRIGYMDRGRFVAIRDVPEGIVFAIAGDRHGNIWVANTDLGLLRISGDRIVERIPWARLGHTGYARALAVDPLSGDLWLGFLEGGIEHLKNGQIVASYGAKERLSSGRINDLRFSEDGVLWIATPTGLSRLKDGRLMTLSSRDGLPCNLVHWTMEDDHADLWASTACGVVRIARGDLDELQHPDDRDGLRSQLIHVTVFDGSNGIRLRNYEGAFSPRVAKARDGRLWFFPLEGLVAIDPAHLSRDTLPPLVHIEQIDVDHHRFPVSPIGSVHLPARSRDIAIGYTGLSFSNPQGVRFRYRLDGRDREWQDAGNRRQAFYSDLPPGAYHFQLTASNKDGVWNEKAASVDFTVAPAYYQTAWFRALIVAGALTLLWALYQLRLRQLAREFDGRLHERVTERTRIARELHDTLLQSFQGLMLRLQVVDDLLPEGRAKRQLEQALERGDQAIAEGRNAVYDLRGAAVGTNDLAESVRALGEELATQDLAEFHLMVEGTARDLNPILRDEVYRITREALRNAFRHARARHVETEIVYGDQVFRVRVRDDGEGIQQSTLEQGREGHYGLQGMRERARQAGGTLDIWSRPGAGTEIDLSITGAIAYQRSPDRRWLGLLRKRAG